MTGVEGVLTEERQRPSRTPAYLGTNTHCPSLPPPKQTGGRKGTLFQPDLKAPGIGTIPFLPSANIYLGRAGRPSTRGPAKEQK